MQIKKATRKQVKLRLAISGPSGSGKTTAGLNIGTGMSRKIGGRIGVIDTENGSASLYSDRFDFDTIDLGPPFSPKRYRQAIKAFEDAGHSIIIIDGGSHEWTGPGGCLEMNEILAQTKFKGNTWSAWSVTTPEHRAFVDAITQSPCHIITTFRSKTETVQEGKQVRKIGMKEETRDGTEYEFTTLLGITHDNHYAVALKDRTGLFTEPFLVTEKTGEDLIDWLNRGAYVLGEHPDIDAIQNATNVDELKAAFTKAYNNKELESRRLEVMAIKDARKLVLTTPHIGHEVYAPPPVQAPPPASKPVVVHKPEKFKADIEKLVATHENRLPDIATVIYDEIFPRVAGREVTSAADLSDVEANKAWELILQFISKEGQA